MELEKQQTVMDDIGFSLACERERSCMLQAENSHLHELFQGQQMENARMSDELVSIIIKYFYDFPITIFITFFLLIEIFKYKDRDNE